MRIAVFCSSSPSIDSKYIDLAYELGSGIADSGAELVSGGGHISAMGAVSRGARSRRGRTIGVIPQKLVDIEFADHDSDELRSYLMPSSPCLVDSERLKSSLKSG